MTKPPMARLVLAAALTLVSVSGLACSKSDKVDCATLSEQYSGQREKFYDSDGKIRPDMAKKLDKCNIQYFGQIGQSSPNGS